LILSLGGTEIEKSLNIGCPSKLKANMKLPKKIKIKEKLVKTVRKQGQQSSN